MQTRHDLRAPAVLSFRLVLIIGAAAATNSNEVATTMLATGQPAFTVEVR